MGSRQRQLSSAPDTRAGTTGTAQHRAVTTGIRAARGGHAPGCRAPCVRGRAPDAAATTSTPSPWTPAMGDRYGQARSPQPTRAHTCHRRRQLNRGWTPTSQDDCPACDVERQEGWAQLLASVRAELFGHDPYRE